MPPCGGIHRRWAVQGGQNVRGVGELRRSTAMRGTAPAGRGNRPVASRVARRHTFPGRRRCFGWRQECREAERHSVPAFFCALFSSPVIRFNTSSFSASYFSISSYTTTRLLFSRLVVLSWRTLQHALSFHVLFHHLRPALSYRLSPQDDVPRSISIFLQIIANRGRVKYRPSTNIHIVVKPKMIKYACPR